MAINFDGIPKDTAGSNEYFQDFFFDDSMQDELGYLASVDVSAVSVDVSTSVTLYDDNGDGLPDRFISSWTENGVPLIQSGTITYGANGLLTIIPGVGDSFETTGRLGYNSAGDIVGLYTYMGEAATGKIITDFGGDDYGYSIVMQPDGKILVAGESDGDFALARYNSDGSLDNTFSGDGQLTTDFGGDDSGSSVAVQGNGNILVAGYTFNGSNDDFALVRYNSDGSPDMTFGSDGKVTTDFGGDDYGYSMVMQSDGIILVAGESDGDVALARYNSDGSLDTTFSGDGKLTTDFGGYDSCWSVAAQNNGKILVAGTTNNGSSADFALARYNSDGSPDMTFGSEGKVTTDFGGYDYGYSMVIQSDGTILVAGESDGDFALARYNSDGSLDTTFSSDGKLTTDFGDYDSGWSMTTQVDGTIIISGSANNGSNDDFALVRYNRDGSLDMTFGSEGKLATDFGYDDYGCSVTAQSDGRILVAGYTYNGDSGVSDFALARYNTDGTLDASFDGVSETYTHTGTSGNDFADLYTISGNTSLPGNVTTYVFDGMGGTDTLTLSMDGAYLGCFLSTNFAIPATPNASGRYVISGTIMSDIIVTLQLTSVEQLVFADRRVSLDYPSSFDETPPTVVTFNPSGISTDSRIGVTFNEEIQWGTGYVYIRGDGGYSAEYDVANSPDLTISGSTVYIQPPTALETNSSYTVRFSEGSIQDMAGNGCLPATDYHFNTNVSSSIPPSTAPQVGFGKVATDFGGGYDFATGVTTQADGKIIVAGSSVNCGSMDVALVRYNADGSLDSSFGGAQGKITTDFGYGDIGACVPQLSDGKILVIGQSVINWGSDGKGILARYNADGTLDTSFDGDGKVITILDGMSGLYFGSGMVQEDGKIVVVGTVYAADYDSNAFVVLRYNSNGSLDTGFDGDGVVVTPISGFDRAQSVVQQSDGNILVAGTSYNGVDNDIVLVRYNMDGSIENFVITDFEGNEQLGNGDVGGGVSELSDGRILVVGRCDGNVALLRYTSDLVLDTSFSDDGKVVLDSGGNVQPYGLAVLPDGKILVSGCSDTDVVLLRFNEDGTLDSTFAGGGKVIANIGLANGGIFSGAMTLQADGKILLSGQSNGDMGVVRFNADGTLDTTFGLSVNTAPAFSESRAGTITTDFGGEDTGRSVIAQPDGRILVAGYTDNGAASHDVALARYIVDGTHTILDTSFGIGGKLVTDFGGNDYGLSLVLSDGKILLTGSTTVANGTADFVLARFNSDGTLDSTFATNGKVITDFTSSDDTGNSIKVLSDGKILVAGTSGSDFALARYNSNGTLDTTFYGGGQFTTDFSGTESGMSVTVQSNGKILVAGTTTLPGGNADFALARYNADGSLDTTFHGEGKLTTDFGGTDSAQSVVVQSDGKILVAGSSIAIMDGVAMFNSNFVLARYNADGSLDTTFHGDGRLTTDFGATEASGCSVILQSDGKILVAGSSTNADGKSDFALARYNTDGTLDASFSGDGRFTMDFGGSSDTCYSISVQSDGKILVAGTSDIDGNGDFALAQINTDGTLDTSFGGHTVTPIYTETPVVLDGGLQINDAELATIGHFDGATLTLMRHDGAVAEDLFSNTGTLGALTEGGSLVVGTSAIGTVKSNSDGMLEVCFNADATPNLVNAVLQQIAYSNSSPIPEESVPLDWLFSDGNTGSQGSGGVLNTLHSTTVQIGSDTVAPTVTDFNPADTALDVAVGSDIVVTFSEAIQMGAGTIEIHSGTSDGLVLESYDVATSTNLTIEDNTLIINPTDNLTGNTHYYVTFDAGSIKDMAGNSYVGTGSYDFTTASIGSDDYADSVTDTTAPMGSIGIGSSVTGNIESAGDHDFFRISLIAGTTYTIRLSGADSELGTLDDPYLQLCDSAGLEVAYNDDGGTGYDSQLSFTPTVSGTYYVDAAAYDDSEVGTYQVSVSGESNGKVITDFGGDDSGNSMAIQSDGKILVAGFTENENGGDFALARYNSDGTLDNTFSVDGKIITDFGGNDYGWSVVIQSDGKILVAGDAYNESNNDYDFAVVRYNSDGTLDHTFSDDGKVITDFGGGGDFGRSMVIQSDGKIFVAGDSDGDFALARYNSDGTLDNTFSGDGKLTTDFGDVDSCKTIAIQSDGKILVAGYAYNGSNNDYDFAVVRYNSDGTLDNTFSDDGKVATDFGGNSYGRSMVIQSDGKILVAGDAYNESNNDWDFAIVRYNADGTLDNTFSDDGKVTTDFGDDDSGYSITIQSDGKILVAGETHNIGDGCDFAVVRYNSDGSLDNTFSEDGKVVTDFGDDNFAYSIAIQSDGKILVTGNAYNESNDEFDFALARYNTDGTLDTSFGESANGLVTTTADSGTGSLRSAIEYLNANGAIDSNSITFAVSGIIDLDNPLPVIARPVSFDMGENNVEVRLVGASVVDGMATPALSADNKIEILIPANLTITSEGSSTVIAVGSSGDLVTGEIAGTLNAFALTEGVDYSEAIGMWSGYDIHIEGDLSGTVAVEARDEAIGLGAFDLQIFGDVSGTVTATASAGFALGIIAADHLTITGQISDTAFLDVTGSSVAVGIVGFTGAVDIIGDMAGNVVVTSSNGVAYGICTSTDEINLGSYSGVIMATGNTTVVGIGAGINSLEFEPFEPLLSGNLTIHGDFSGDVTVTSVQGYAFGVMAANNLAIEGDVTDTAAISVTVTGESPDNGVCIIAINDLVITGDMAGTLETKATEAGGMGSINGTVTLGALTGSVNVDGDDVAVGIRAQSVTINDTLSGDITVDGSRSDAYGIEARSGDVIVGGDLSGTVTVSALNWACGLKSNQSMMLGTLSGDISAVSSNSFALGVWAAGEINGCTPSARVAAQPLSISGTISAEGVNSAAIVAGGPMNLTISGTVSGSATASSGLAFSILSFTSFNPDWTFNSAAVSDQVTVTGTGKLTGNVNLGAGDDIMTLQDGADVSGVALLDGGAGTDRLVLSGSVAIDLSALSSKVRNFEIIDLSDGAHNTLSISSTNDIVLATDVDHDLYIVGDSCDTVRFSSTGEIFTTNEITTIDCVEYARYTTFADATVDLYVQSDLVVEFADVTSPTVINFSPADAEMGVAVDSDIVVTFSEDIQFGSGTIAIHSGSPEGDIVESYDVATSTNLTINDTELTINPTTDLALDTQYFVTFANGSVEDLAGNSFAGTTAYDFTTEETTALHHINGTVTFWKTGAFIADVTSTLSSASVAAGTQAIEFRNIQVDANGTRTIEIWETSQKSNINSVDLEFSLSAGSASTWQDASGLPSGWMSVANTGISGKFMLSGIGLTALSAGPVKLGTLTLTEPTNAQHFDLTMTSGELNGEALPAFGISSDSTITGIDGIYQHSDMANGMYELTTDKVAGAAECDAVKATDALAALKMAVGMNPNTDGSAVSPYQFLAADINHDGKVKSTDALNILKMAVHLDTAPASEWIFVPESVGSESMTRTHVDWPDDPVAVTFGIDQELDLIGIVKGDVDGSWAA